MKAIARLLNNRKIFPYVFLAFPLILIYSMNVYPILHGFYMSLFKYKLSNPKNKPFVGFQNYIDLLTDKIFLRAFKNTMEFAVEYVVIGLIIGLILALVVFQMTSKMQNLIKSLYFLPVVVSMIPVAIIFGYLFRPNTLGPINYYLSLIGIEGPKWGTDPNWAFKVILFLTLWKNAGFLMIVYFAALLNIPKMYYESAKIDGANAWNIFWNITLPLLKSTTVFLLVTGFIAGFQVFTQVFVLVGGTGPNGSCATLAYEIYFRAFNTYDMGSASAMSFVMFFFILLATVLLNFSEVKKHDKAYYSLHIHSYQRCCHSTAIRLDDFNIL